MFQPSGDGNGSQEGVWSEGSGSQASPTGTLARSVFSLINGLVTMQTTSSVERSILSYVRAFRGRMDGQPAARLSVHDVIM